MINPENPLEKHKETHETNSFTLADIKENTMKNINYNKKLEKPSSNLNFKQFSGDKAAG